MKKEFSVFAQNLAYYNEGELIGDWIDLPQNPAIIKEYLERKVKVDSEHEEYEIADVDNLPFSYEIVQWADLYKLNKLAIVYSTLTDENKEAVQAYLDYEGDNYSIEELINICLQADEIEFYQYYFEGVEYCQNCSKEAKMGYTMAEETGLYSELEKLRVIDYFDFEKYGESYGYDYELYDNGYLVMDLNLDLNYYSENEINEKIQEILEQDLDYELEEREV